MLQWNFPNGFSTEVRTTGQPSARCSSLDSASFQGMALTNMESTRNHGRHTVWNCLTASHPRVRQSACHNLPCRDFAYPQRPPGNRFKNKDLQSRVERFSGRPILGNLCASQR